MERKQKYSTLLVLFCNIAAMVFLLSIPRFYLIEEGISRNDHFIVFWAWIISLIRLALPFLAAKWFPASADFDRTWCQKPRTKIRWYILLFLLPFIAQIITALLAKYAGLSVIHPYTYKNISQLSLAFFLLDAFRIAIMDPISEEIFWRGYVQDQFCKCFGKKIALFSQAFLFAILHFRPLLGFTNVFAMGLIFGFWRQKRRSLLPVIIVHIVINGFYALAHYPGLYELSQVKPRINYIEELNKSGNILPPEDNAASFYQKACKLFINPPKEIQKLLREDKDPNHLDLEWQKGLSLWMTQNNDAMDQFRKGLNKPFYWPTYSGTSMTDITFREPYNELRGMANILRFNALLSAQNGQFEKAIDELSRGYQLGNHLFNGPKPDISKVVALGIKRNICGTGYLILDTSPMDPNSLSYFLTQFQQLLQDADQNYDLSCEKFTQLDNIQRYFTDDGKGNGHIPRLYIKAEKDDPKKIRRVFSPELTDERIEKWALQNRKQAIEMIDDLFIFFDDIFTKTPAQLRKESIDADEVIWQKAGHSILYISVQDALKMHDIFYRCKADESAFMSTLAILYYKNVRHDFPENLEILVSQGYLKSQPMDPYSDKPLVYRKAGESFILYSIGCDFEDNGGKHSRDWGKKDGDYVFWPLQKDQDETK